MDEKTSAVEPFFTLINTENEFVNICTAENFDIEEKKVLIIEKKNVVIYERDKAEDDILGDQ